MAEEQILTDGFTAPGFEKVMDVFKENLKSGLDKGGSFAVYYKGECVVNIWGGHCDNECPRPWKEDTLSTFFSTTKAISAIVIAHLVDRGVLDYDEKVCTYWPEFAQNGKESITLKQLISNQAGLSSLEEPFWIAEMRDDPESLTQKLAKQRPFWTPGEKHGYHPLTFGLYLDRIVTKVDKKGRSLAQYFAEEIAKPFDIEIYIGLPKDQFYRATRIVEDKTGDFATLLENFKGDLDLFKKACVGPLDFQTVPNMNDPSIRQLPVPSISGHATARNMAKLFGIIANGGEADGKTLLSQNAIKRFTEPIVAGYGVSFGLDTAWSVGTHLWTLVSGNKPPTQIFGHGGYGGQYAGSDVTHKVGFAYTTSFLDASTKSFKEGDPRLNLLTSALYKCIFEKEKITEEPRLFRFHSTFKKYLEEKNSL